MHTDVESMTDRIAHAHRVERILQRLGWVVAAVGLVGAVVFVAFWVAGDLNAEQAVSLLVGTTLATILSGAGAYGSGVNVGLGADRLALAVDAAGRADPGRSDASGDGD